MALNKNLLMTDTGGKRSAATTPVTSQVAQTANEPAKTPWWKSSTAVADESLKGRRAAGQEQVDKFNAYLAETWPEKYGPSPDPNIGSSSGLNIFQDVASLKAVGSAIRTGQTPGTPQPESENNGFPGSDEPGAGGGGSGGYGSGGGALAGVGGYTAAQLTPATSQADYINAMYDANEQRQRAALESAYDANVATLDRQAATIAPQFQQAANAAAAQSAVAQAAFNERAAAAGMNTGAGSQAALAQNNTLQGNISAIRQAESEALAEVEAQRASLAQQYQKAIAEAVANNEAERAQALYAEAIRVDESLVSTAVNQAAENFNEWQAMYKLAKG